MILELNNNNNNYLRMPPKWGQDSLSPKGSPQLKNKAQVQKIKNFFNKKNKQIMQNME